MGMVSLNKEILMTTSTALVQRSVFDEERAAVHMLPHLPCPLHGENQLGVL